MLHFRTVRCNPKSEIQDPQFRNVFRNDPATAPGYTVGSERKTASRRMQVNQIGRLTKSMTTGDAAVDGLLGGLGASIVMALVLMALGVTGGQAPLSTLAHFDPGRSSALTGLLMHLAVGSVYGTLFSLGWL